MSDLDILVKPQHKRLGRQMVHDERSRAFAVGARIDRSTWRDKAIRIYDPTPNPNQEVGCCTGVAKAIQFNAVGNRAKATVLTMTDALGIYSRATQIDPWEGSWPPEDTGSSGLASAKVAVEQGLGGEYRWLFGGADEVVQTIMAGQVVSAGTWWYADMFGDLGGSVSGGSSGASGKVPVLKPTGGQVGGHQYVLRGYDRDTDRVLGRCWWGPFKDFWIARTDLDALLRDGGDAHIQRRV